MTDDTTSHRPEPVFTLEAFKCTIEEIKAGFDPSPYMALIPRNAVDAAIAEFGGRLERCRRPGLEAYDEIVGHREGQGLILLAERPESRR